jgi:hypothetical protein
MTAKIRYEGELRTTCTHEYSNSSITTDAPLDNQGKAESFSPTDLLATSLGACAMTIMGIKARDMEIDLAGTQITVEKMMKSEPRRVGGINLTFIFPAKATEDPKQRTIIERVAHSCPVFFRLHPDIELDIHFEWI